jgi:rhodanese-related sulfurtransferase
MKKQLIIIFTLAFSLSACGQNHASFQEMALEMSKGSAPKTKGFTLNDTKMPNIVYLDAREKEEFEVSHIKGAIFVGYENFDIKNLPELEKTATIVVYCSVGYRSEKIAEELIQHGYTQTQNLFGGIFDWINKGYSVYDATGKETQKIHGYSKSWAKWLTKGEKVYE